jgi:hypothetical protein
MNMWNSTRVRVITGVERRAVAGVRRRGTGIAHAVMGAAVMRLVLVGWRCYAAWRSGQVELSTEGESVVVQVLQEESEQPVGEPVGLIDRAVFELPAGEYKLRVDGKGRLGRTFRFSVNRGETLAHTISIDEGRLLGGAPAPAENDEKRPFPMRVPCATATAALELNPGKADLIGCTEKTLIRRDGATGKVIWEAESPHTLAAGESLRQRLLWRATQAKVPRTGFVEPAPDLDGDGTGDLLLNLRRDRAFVAFSGKNGALLWKYFAAADGQPGSPRSESQRALASLNQGATAGDPAIADVNRDGTPDLIATLVPSESIQQQGRIVVAISGRSGAWLWSYPIDESARTAWGTDFDRPAVLVQGRGSKLVAYVDGSGCRANAAAEGLSRREADRGCDGRDTVAGGDEPGDQGCEGPGRGGDRRAGSRSRRCS